MNLETIRQQYPQYSDLSDEQIARGLHAKHYADMPFEQFAGRIGYNAQPAPVDYHQQMIDEMGTGERLLVGIGRGFAAPGQGIKQGWLHAFGTDEEAAAYDEKIKREQQLYQKLANQSWAAKGGELVGNVAATAPTMLIPGAQAAWLPRLASIGAQGATAAVTQPAVGEGDYLGQKMEQGLLGGTFAAGTAGGLGLLGKTAENLLPSNVVGKVANWHQARRLQTPHGQQGMELVRETGMELSPGAVSGSPLVNQMENMARQSWMTSDMARQADQRVAQQAINYAERVMNRITPDSKSAEGVGMSLRDGIKTAVGKLQSLRDTAAARDYGAVRQMAGDRPIFKMQNALDEARAIMDEYADVAGADAAAIRSQMGDVIKKLGRMEQPPAPPRTGLEIAGARRSAQPPQLAGLNVDQAMRNRSYFSRSAAGTGNLFKDIDKSLDRRLAARMLGAVERDFDATAQAVGGDVAAALKQANGNYRQHMQSIERVKTSVLGKLLGDDVADDIMGAGAGTTVPYERLAEKIRTMKPSELKTAKATLQWAAPEAWDDARRYVLEAALEAGKDVPVSAGGNAVPLNASKYISKLLPDENMRLMFEPQEMREINVLVDGLRRWGDRTGYNFSGTGPYNELSGVLGSLLNFSTQGLTTLGGQALGARGVAKMLANPQARREAMQLVRLPPGSKRASQVAASLASMLLTKEATTPGYKADQAHGRAN